MESGVWKWAASWTARKRLDALALLRIYAAPAYVALLWADWCVESESFFGSSSRLQTGWELTSGIALAPLALAVFLAVIQYSVQLKTPQSLISRFAFFSAGVASVAAHFLCGIMVFGVTVLASDAFFDLKLFSSTGHLEPAYFLAMLTACVYPLAAFAEAVSRFVSNIQQLRNWHHGHDRAPQSAGGIAPLPAPQTDKEEVLLIHGTGSADNEDAGEKWWQIGSPAAVQLELRLPSDVRCHQHGAVFHWSGHNSEQARRNAGRDLLRRLLAYEDAGQSYHLVAHSHGGSVIWHALQLAVRRGCQLNHLRSWTTLGTPFLRYRARHTSLLLLIPLAATVALFALRSDLWRSAANTWDLLISHGYYPTVLLLIAIATVSMLLVAYNLHRVVRALWAHLDCYRDRRVDKHVMRQYGSRWLGLWSRSDEAINGLKGTLRLSRESRRREPVETLNPVHRLIRVVELPFRAAYDRLVRPIVDEFVWGRVIRSIQGNDLPEHILDSVAATPEESFACMPANDEAEQEILAWANTHCERSGGILRASLGLASASDFGLSQVGEHLSSILTGKELVHWSYYHLSFMVDRVADHIRHHACATGSVTSMLSRTPEHVSRPMAPQGKAAVSGIRALVSFQCVVLLAIVLIAQMLDSHVMDQFTPERQIKEVVWRLPKIAHYDQRHTAALLSWSKEYTKVGVAHFDLMNEPEYRRLADLDARVQLALVWAALQNKQVELAVNIANEIKNPFYRVHAGLLVCCAAENAADGLHLRAEYAEDRSVVQALGGQLAEAGTAELLTRSAIMFRSINVTAKSEWHFFWSAETQGAGLAKRAVRHAQAWCGRPDAVDALSNSGGNEGRLSRFSELELLVALQPAEDWYQRATAIALQILADENRHDFVAIPDLYARFGGLEAAAAMPDQLKEPLEDARRKAYEFQLFLALRRHSHSGIAVSEDTGAEGLMRQLSMSSRALDEALIAAQDSNAKDMMDRLAEDDDIEWLPRSYVMQQLIATFFCHGRMVDAQQLTDMMLDEAEEVDRDSYLTSDEAYSLATALAQTRQYFLARQMTEHIADTADRLLIHASILSTYTDDLAEQGRPAAQHYVALYRAKDRELRLRRSSKSEWALFEGTTW